MPQILETIGADETKKTTTQWFQPKALESGSYRAYLVITVNDYVFRQFSESFSITGSK